MFNQIKNLAGGEIYLISSLLMFMVFFIIVALYLFRLNKTYIQAMSELPVQENQSQENEED